jgi:uncharacterized OsmC-like protein
MTAQVLTYGVTASVVGPGVSRGRIAEKSAEVEFDTSAGQSDVLPGPADLLVTAFAACVLKNVERMSSFMPFRYEGATIEVTAERETDPPRMARIHYVLTVVTDESERRLQLLHRNIARQGTIYNTLAQSCEITGEIVARSPIASRTAANGRVSGGL